MGLLQHAERELKAIGMWDSEDEMDQMAVENIMELIRIFSDQGHSGSSAYYVTNIVHDLFQYRPLAPLTGEEWEWIGVDDNLWQNKRATHVFKDDTGAYDIEGKVFVKPNGVAYTSGDSCVEIDFPYMPDTEVVYVDEEENVLDPQPEEA